MRTVYKYTLSISSGDQPVELPVGAVFLHGAVHAGQVSMWFEVDEDAETEWRKFQIFGTGQVIPSDFIHRATCPDGAIYVWHIYERDLS